MFSTIQNHRCLRARRDAQLGERDFSAEYRIPQQTISEWKRDHRVHVTPDILRLGAKLMPLKSPAHPFAQPDDCDTQTRRFYWGAVALSLAADQRNQKFPDVPAVLKILAAAEKKLAAQRRGE